MYAILPARPEAMAQWCGNILAQTTDVGSRVSSAPMLAFLCLIPVGVAARVAGKRGGLLASLFCGSLWSARFGSELASAGSGMFSVTALVVIGFLSVFSILVAESKSFRERKKDAADSRMDNARKAPSPIAPYFLSGSVKHKEDRR